MLGDELVNDGSFAQYPGPWTTAGGWSIEQGPQHAQWQPGAGEGDMSEDLDITAGKTYQVTFAATKGGGGGPPTVKVAVGGTESEVKSVTTTMTLRYYLTAADSGGIEFVAGGDEFLEIDDVSVKEVLGSSDLPSDLTPEGNAGLAQSKLRDLLAECERFQIEVQAEGTEAERIAAAKLRIHLTAYAVDDPAQFTNPYALIMHSGSDKAETIGTTQATGYGGDLELRFAIEVPVQYQATGQEANAEKLFKNFYEKVMLEAMALSGKAGYFAINSWDVIDGPAWLGDNSSEENMYGVRLLINWGII